MKLDKSINVRVSDKHKRMIDKLINQENRTQGYLVRDAIEFYYKNKKV